MYIDAHTYKYIYLYILILYICIHADTSVLLTLCVYLPVFTSKVRKKIWSLN